MQNGGASKLKNAKGYTLLEIVLVLTAMTIMIPVAVNGWLRAIEWQQLDGFVAELREIIFYAQMTAITEERYVDVEFHNDEHRVDVVMAGELIKSIDAGNKIQFEKGTHSLSLSFSPNGTLVNNAGTLFVKTHHFAKKFVFLLGQGRFYVENAS
ncbi:competence type IV pilus minor pilin ComGD [Tuberibacillus calidus]|jgi:competence protein ComGD|uniref:competence type IV pilus minor pilin ComGD n=1 Tax=Tuberibacillus calidus TaxID=340097 RepID=UPI0004035E04|nr:competence type IV pilus minor pilin ComGD [Tuberibacillus calidus]